MRNIVLLGGSLDNLADRRQSGVMACEDIDEMKRLLGSAMDKTLTERQRKCLSMYYFDELRMEEIAKRLGISKSTVSRHITAAKKKLDVLKVLI